MRIILITLVLLTITKQCFAVDEISSDMSSNGKKHILGIDLGLGSVDSNNYSIEVDEESIIRFTYGYQLNSVWVVSTGVIRGNGKELCIGTCLELRALDYNSYILNIKGSYPLINRWSVFGKLGANYYDVDLSGANKANVMDSGVGALIATGVDFRAYNGFGFGIEISFQDMGIITSTSLSANFSYMF